MPVFDNIEEFNGVSVALQWAMFIVAALIVLLAIVSVFVSIWLFFRYVKFNRRKNSAGITGSEAARRILDDNGCENIKVSVVGSVLFGNSYSHYFKKIRLRRLIDKKKSITSLSMGAQKSALAILDKEGDPDMKQRVALIPVTYFGPIAFIPIVLVGVLLDIFIFGFTGVATVIAAVLGLLYYIAAFILSLKVLKTEIKAQNRSIELLKSYGMATEEELEMMRELFKLYNIQYVNDMIMAFLEVILRILSIIAKIQGSSSSSSSD